MRNDANERITSAAYSWVPSREQLEEANVVRLARELGCGDYRSLHRVSVEEPDRFWRAVRTDLRIPFARECEVVIF
jgi:acetyl-CoA synthetase